MLAEQAGVELDDADRQAIAAQMRQLPAHPEVRYRRKQWMSPWHENAAYLPP
jgi:hypothetical protein